nr:PWWP domain-containing DNA repair factor 3A-like [Misgurnus anguillicaudatus]
MQPVYCPQQEVSYWGPTKSIFFFLKRHGKRFAHWTEEARCLTEGTLRPLYMSFPGLTHDLPQHVVAERNRMLSNQALVDFIVARGTDNHIQSIINGQKKSKWLDTFSKCSIKKVPVPLFIEDKEQIDVIYTHLTSIWTAHTHSDQIRFIMDVLFPEVC